MTLKSFGKAFGLVTSLSLVVYALFYEKFFFEVKHILIGDRQSSTRIKLLFLTDLHIKKYLDPSYRKLAQEINKINPDLILFSGDIIDEDGIYAPAKKFFSLLNYSIQKVGILGNHDHKNRVKLMTYKQLFANNNGYLLYNESRMFTFSGKRVMVTGVDDFIEGTPSFAKAVKGVGNEPNHVLLIHSPLQQEGILKEMARLNGHRKLEDRLNIQYIFAGHNHGGQVCIFGYAPVLPKKSGNYLKGWYNTQAPFLYLSKGFGTSTLPFRFGARSEITVFHYGV